MGCRRDATGSCIKRPLRSDHYRRGLTGLFAACCAGSERPRTRIIDCQPDPGGQITALYPDRFIYDAAGCSKVLGKDLVHNRVEQAMQQETAATSSPAIENALSSSVIAPREEGVR